VHSATRPKISSPTASFMEGPSTHRSLPSTNLMSARRSLPPSNLAQPHSAQLNPRCASSRSRHLGSSTFGAPGRGLGFKFLLVFLLNTMVQIVEHSTETSADFLVEEEAASFTPQVPSRPVRGTAAVHAARQHTTAQASRTPSRAAPGALSVARELLRHPPSSTASQGAMKQWRDDVD
jgi:hypothetical protein